MRLELGQGCLDVRDAVTQVRAQRQGDRVPLGGRRRVGDLEERTVPRDFDTRTARIHDRTGLVHTHTCMCNAMLDNDHARHLGGEALDRLERGRLDVRRDCAHERLVRPGERAVVVVRKGKLQAQPLLRLALPWIHAKDRVHFQVLDTEAVVHGELRYRRTVHAVASLACDVHREVLRTEQRTRQTYTHLGPRRMALYEAYTRNAILC